MTRVEGPYLQVCGVFGYDAAKVTLFYEPGSVSRFVRQNPACPSQFCICLYNLRQFSENVFQLR